MFGFHPDDPYQCPRLYACPHLLGASLERVVSSANWFQDLSNQQFHEIERLRREVSERDQRIEQLEQEIAATRRKLKDLQRGRFQGTKRPPCGNWLKRSMRGDSTGRR
jgi:hypothetical protein